MSKKEKKLVGVRLTPQLHKEVQIYAVMNDTNVSDLIEELVREFLQSNVLTPTAK